MYKVRRVSMFHASPPSPRSTYGLSSHSVGSASRKLHYCVILFNRKLPSESVGVLKKLTEGSKKCTSSNRMRISINLQQLTARTNPVYNASNLAILMHPFRRRNQAPCKAKLPYHGLKGIGWREIFCREALCCTYEHARAVTNRIPSLSSAAPTFHTLETLGR